MSNAFQTGMVALSHFATEADVSDQVEMTLTFKDQRDMSKFKTLLKHHFTALELNLNSTRVESWNLDSFEYMGLKVKLSAPARS